MSSNKAVKQIGVITAFMIMVGTVLAACNGGAVTTVEVPGETVVETVQVPVEMPVNQPTITFWSFEIQPDRAARTQMIIERFTAKTGINVELVLVVTR
jgi:ABC-type glycerol-3-phosphate transport system substrate-binding protein